MRFWQEPQVRTSGEFNVAAFHADLITMFVIMVPLYAMYEVSVWTALLFGKKRLRCHLHSQRRRDRWRSAAAQMLVCRFFSVSSQK
jgi:hypothetical protein